MRSNSLALASPPRSSSLSTDPLVESTEQANPTDANEAANQAPLQAAIAAPQWSSEQLLAGAEEATITHGDQVYRLRRTLTGKLILTK